ncbi:hypothetical protein [Acidovorax temperans]|uniref:hypothetical protein n=1 Tax=Acidovorax temperans TaxID=80878 RepID=UPI00289BA87E|nr:hypothetical protein [Acidovorax temperans]
MLFAVIFTDKPGCGDAQHLATDHTARPYTGTVKARMVESSTSSKAARKNFSKKGSKTAGKPSVLPFWDCEY